MPSEFTFEEAATPETFSFEDAAPVSPKRAAIADELESVRSERLPKILPPLAEGAEHLVTGVAYPFSTVRNLWRRATGNVPVQPGTPLVPFLEEGITPEQIQKYWRMTGDTTVLPSGTTEPIAGSITAGSRMAAGLTSPEMAPFALSGGVVAPVVKRAIPAVFTWETARHIPEASAEAGRVSVEGGLFERGEAYTGLGITAAIPAHLTAKPVMEVFLPRSFAEAKVRPEIKIPEILKPEPSEVPNASRVEKAAEVYEPVPAQPVPVEKGVPTKESGEGVLPTETPQGEVLLTPEKSADIARFKELESEFQTLIDKGDFESAEFVRLFAEKEAIKERHEGFVPGRETPLGRKELETAEGVEFKAATEISKTSREEGQRPAKEAKEELVQKLETAIQKFDPEKSKITIEIPGDGTFTIVNTLESLKEVLSRARRLSTSAEPKAAIHRVKGKLTPEDEQVINAYGSPEEAYRRVAAQNAMSEPEARAESLLYNIYQETKAGKLESQSEVSASTARERRSEQKEAQLEIDRINGLKRQTAAHKESIEYLTKKVESTGERAEFFERSAEEFKRKSEKEKQELEKPLPGIQESPPSGPGAKTSGEPVVTEHSKTAKTDDAFERAREGDEKAFDDLDSQFRETYPDPEELQYPGSPNPNQVFTTKQFADRFNSAFARHDFDTILDTLKATSDVSIWKPFLRDLFKAQAKDPVAAEKAAWMRHVFNGTRPANAIPRPPPRPSGTQRPPPPVTPTPRPKPGAAHPPKPPPTPPSPPPERIPVEPITGGGAKSPFKIIEDFSESIGKAIRVRRLKSNTLGTYSPGSTLTAEKFAGDLDTAAHELAGHWTDDRYGIGKPWVAPKTRSPYDTELAKFWIHGSVTPRSTLRYRRAEGIAEYIRAYVVNPKMAKAEAPNFTAYFEKTVTPEGLKAIRDFSNDVRIWAGEDPIVRAGLNMRMEPPSLRERLWMGLRGRGFGFEISPIDRLRLWFDDPYHYAVKAFREANALRGGTLLPQDNFELQARLLATHESRMSDQLEFGLTPLRPKQVPNAVGRLEVERLVDPVTKEPMTMKWLLGSLDKSSKDKFNQDMRDASAYMVAQRTLEKGKQTGREANISGIGAGILTDKAAAEALLRRVEADPVREARLKESARRYRLWADKNIDMLVESGRLSKSEAERIRRDNQQYVDMHRLSMEFETANRKQRGVKIGTTSDVLKRFKGSTLELDNVYANLLEQTDAIQKEAFRNVAMNTFTDSLRNVRELHGANLIDFDQFGSRASSADANTITVYKNGKAEFWKFDPDIHASLKGLGELGTHAFIDLLSLPSTFARYMITHGPQFVIRNPIRDTFERSVVSRNGSKPWDILRGFTQEDLSRYEIFGGGQFGNYIVDRHVWNRELKKVAAELRKDPNNILLSPFKLKTAWENISEKSEKLGRIAEFRRAFDKGKKELGYDDYNAALYAAGEARGLIDFAKAGTVMRAINRLVPFSNARVRGLARSAFSIKDNPAGFAMRWGMFVLVPTLLNAIYQRMDADSWEEYQQLPAYQKDFFWNFKVGPYWIRIPKPHEMGVMASGVQRAIDRMLGDERAMEGWGGSVASGGLPVSTPVEGTGPLKTFLELHFNRDTFRGRDIIPAWEKDLKLELRKGTEHASTVSKGTANAINATGLEIDPRHLDYLLGALGGIGQISTMAFSPKRSDTDTAIKSTGLVTESTASAARDVQWVMDWARENGKLNSSEFSDLRDLRKAVMDSKDPVDRDNLSRKLRQLGTLMRDRIESAKENP